MSFIGEDKKGFVYAPGWFLADDEGCVRVTKTVPDTGDHVTTTDDGAKVALGGTFVAALGGILYEDVDLANGAAPGSVVIAGKYYGDRVVGTVSGVASLVNVGDYPAVTRPDFDGSEAADDDDDDDDEGGEG